MFTMNNSKTSIIDKATKEEHSITLNQMDNKYWELNKILCKIIEIK